ncbi:hypothetical protein [Aliiroseovarius sp. F47248L]|uniref:hypothetical protein n=1 Tax=Aliiroseovarius sp. F47248L TaxID=2926420 RepID=UPI001FF40D5F|nr:hypothetical protein [Aliiroseovarius sp. F47248L]MCK0140631.1 hypothetical protein [Aliiroseovarius sp. F47248L]
MEILFAIVIFGLAAVGLGLGLTFGRDPVRTSCGASAGLREGRCSDCPLRHRAEAAESQE